MDSRHRLNTEILQRSAIFHPAGLIQSSLKGLKEFFGHHPCVRDALLWSIPALLIGALLRLFLLTLQPYAYWGADSGSYFWFAQRLILEGQISLPAKRQFLYPVFLVPVAALPGAILSTLAWVQHGMGLLTIVTTGYCARKLFAQWKILIIPATVLFSILPITLWYEHELIGEVLFSYGLAWGFAGWLAWRGRGFCASSYWVFLILFAVGVLTKSAGRFFWPGILIGLIFYGRKLRWPHLVATLVLLIVSWTMGEKSQGVRLLYTSAFPLTRMDTALQADLKAEIAGLVQTHRESLSIYHFNDSAPKEFLRTGFKNKNEYPAWAALGKEERKLWKSVREIALEAVSSHPIEFAGIGFRRAVASLDLTRFRCERFSRTYFPERFNDQMSDFLERGELGRVQLAMLFGIPVPDDNPETLLEAAFAHPARASWDVHLQNFAEAVHWIVSPVLAGETGGFEITPSGWILLASLLLSLLPWRFSGAGVWWLVLAGYAFGVHLLGSANPRFLLPLWPILCVLIMVPADMLAARLREFLKMP